MLEKSAKLWSQFPASREKTFALPAGEPGTMSMLDFYTNRAGRNLSAAERKHLEKAKTALSASGKEQR